MPKEPDESTSEFLKAAYLAGASAFAFTPETTRTPTPEEIRMADELIKDWLAQVAEWTTG